MESKPKGQTFSLASFIFDVQNTVWEDLLGMSYEMSNLNVILFCVRERQPYEIKQVFSSMQKARKPWRRHNYFFTHYHTDLHLLQEKLGHLTICSTFTIYMHEECSTEYWNYLINPLKTSFYVYSNVFQFKIVFQSTSLKLSLLNL